MLAMILVSQDMNLYRDLTADLKQYAVEFSILDHDPYLEGRVLGTFIIKDNFPDLESHVANASKK
jgi:hypothetical protein